MAAQQNISIQARGRYRVVWLHSAWYEYGSKALIASLYIRFLYQHVNAYLAFQSPVYIVYATMEAIVVLMVLSRKGATERLARPFPICVALVGTFLPLLFQPNGDVVAPAASLILTVLGALIVMGGYLSLNSSFGTTPAIREVKMRGMYGYVRHPIYLGYIPVPIGYLLTNMSFFNIGIVAAIWIAMGLRMYYEEQVLAHDEQYRAYQTRVRYRLVPGVY